MFLDMECEPSFCCYCTGWTGRPGHVVYPTGLQISIPLWLPLQEDTQVESLISMPTPCTFISAVENAFMTSGLSIPWLNWAPGFTKHGLSIPKTPGRWEVYPCQRLIKHGYLSSKWPIMYNNVGNIHFRCTHTSRLTAITCMQYDSSIQWLLWLWNLRSRLGSSPVLQLHLNQCDVLALPGIHVNLYPKGFVCIDLLSEIMCRAANPVIDQCTRIDQNFSIEVSGSCTWCGWLSLGTSNHLFWPE